MIVPGTPAASVSRRRFLHAAGLATAGICSEVAGWGATTSAPRERWFKTRGAVIVVRDMETHDWPALAREAGLDTLATHVRPREIEAFFKTDAGHRFKDGCRRHGIALEHELHALADLLPRELFDKDPSMFRMNDQGERVRDRKSTRLNSSHT